MEILLHRINGTVMAHFSRMCTVSHRFTDSHFLCLFSSLNQQVSVTGNSSTYSFRASRQDNQVKYECLISNQALTVPLRLETYLHVKCK